MSDSGNFHQFYQHHLQHFGASAQGVGWKNEEAQIVRFKQLYKLMASQVQGSFSINDLGCGVGDFVNFLSSYTHNFTYIGYDIMPDMIEKGRTKYESNPHVTFKAIETAEEMIVSDYTIASGIFNIRFDTNDEDWLKQTMDTLQVMNRKSKLGFAFNVLSIYSDVEYRKKELYYADPCFLFDYCKRSFSKNVALLHDYDQYDFTLIIRK